MFSVGSSVVQLLLYTALYYNMSIVECMIVYIAFHLLVGCDAVLLLYPIDSQ